MKYTLVLYALLVLGASLGAAAAPKPGMHTPKKHAAKRMPATPVAVDRSERTPQGTPGGFRDVPPDHWAAQSVETLRRAGIVKGYPDSGK